MWGPSSDRNNSALKYLNDVSFIVNASFASLKEKFDGKATKEAKKCVTNSTNNARMQVVQK